ncbi:MAG: N-acetyl-gamma-glutamyl-phosphate reductase [Clostridiales bacterium]|nr:N-acetyl-gamma-glutamyl-phosphate reductase [Clostridiales bacterium]
MIKYKPKIYIDGREGTTGLQIYERLGGRSDIRLLLIDEAKRKDRDERKRLINSADIVFLCLPDDAAREAVSMCENDATRIIDASTAHRTRADWAYGFPELSRRHREAVAKSKRVANPGCHATGFLASVYPLVELGILSADDELACVSLTGYSGGGKKMIRDYEQNKTPEMSAPGFYGLAQSHKHLPEMVRVAGLSRAPVFMPVVDDYYCGMATAIAIHGGLAGGAAASKVHEALSGYYTGERFVKVAPELGSGTLFANVYACTNMLEITVSGNDECVTVTSRFDNLGKGASGAAVQNMNIMLGLPEDTGL